MQVITWWNKYKKAQKPDITGSCALKLYALSAYSDLVVAIAAIDRSVRMRFERHFGVFTTLGARCREHLPLPAAIATMTGTGTL